MKRTPFRTATAVIAALALAACSSGGTTATGGTAATTPAPTPTPTNGCSLRERQDWVAAQINEWYLFPELIASGLNPGNYASVQDYIDALVAPARAQGRDRFFTYITSIAEENAFFSSGQSAGFGFRLSVDAAQRRAFMIEVFEGTPALNAGVDRGTEILAIGTAVSTLRNVSEIIAAEGTGGVSNALGPSTAGTSRVLRVTDAASGTRTITMTKTDFALTPVSSRYGVRIINEAGQQYGYVNLRTFIDTADPALRQAFAQFRAAGITRIIVDFRYNGGGLVSIANLMGDLIGGARSTGDVWSYTAYRASKASNDSTRFFQPNATQSALPVRLAFISTGATASASELVVNGFLPYFGANEALVGSNSYGKPVGQIALDRSACDDRLRVVAFASQNRDRQGNYYNGLASVMQSTCAAADDITRQMGDPAEASTRAAINFLAGQSCTTPITSGAQSAQSGSSGPRPLTPERPSVAQIETPGLF